MSKTYSILLVDDDSEFLEILARRLQRSGFTVTMATTGREAIAHSEAGAFHAAIVDRNLPDIDAPTLLAGIRQCAAHMKVVLLTGESVDDPDNTAQALGVFAYLTKPCTLAHIAETVQGAAEAAESSLTA